MEKVGSIELFTVLPDKEDSFTWSEESQVSYPSQPINPWESLQSESIKKAAVVAGVLSVPGEAIDSCRLVEINAHNIRKALSVGS